MAEPTAAQLKRVKMAIIAKAARLLKLPSAPFGAVGEATEWGVQRVLPDYQIGEMLYGIRYILAGDESSSSSAWDTLSVTPAEVIRVALGGDAASYSVDQLADIELAIEVATDWVFDMIEGHGFA